jgi:hypothetical protein
MWQRVKYRLNWFPLTTMLIVKARPQSNLCRFVMCLLMLFGVQTFAEGVPDDCTQLMLGTAPTWNSMRGELRLFERPSGGDWKVVAGPFPVLFGKNGLAWGTGISGQNESISSSHGRRHLER